MLMLDPGGAQSKGPAADGTHGSNIAVILESLTKDAALASKAEEYGTVKFVTELSLEELMAGQLSGVHAARRLPDSFIRWPQRNRPNLRLSLPSQSIRLYNNRLKTQRCFRPSLMAYERAFTRVQRVLIEGLSWSPPWTAVP